MNQAMHHLQAESTPIRSSVRFSSAVRVRVIHSPDLSDDEFKASYYSKEEYHKMKIREAKLAHVFVPETPEIEHRMQCLNALVTRSAREEANQKAKSVTRLVLLEQEKQWGMRRRSSALLSSKYKDLSLGDRLLARERAEFLAQHVESLHLSDNVTSMILACDTRACSTTITCPQQQSMESPWSRRWSGSMFHPLSPSVLKDKIDAAIPVPSRKLSRVPLLLSLEH